MIVTNVPPCYIAYTSSIAQEALMAKKYLLTTFILLILLLSTSTYADDIPNGDSTETIDMVYFYVNMCENCTEAKEQIDAFMDTIDASNLLINTRFITYNLTYYDGPEYELYLNYLNTYDLTTDDVSPPILFLGDQYFLGDTEIEAGLAESLDAIVDGYRPNTPILDANKDSSKALTDTFDSFNALKMLGIGLVNGLNPCSFSMLLLLLSIIMMKDVPFVKLTFSFLFGKWVAFLVLGTILYQTLASITGTSYLFVTKLIVGLLVIGLASLNLYDFYVSRQEAYGKIKNQLPSRLRKANHHIIQFFTGSNKKSLLFGSLFLLGMIIAAGEFLCTGQIYMVTINYMIQSQSALSGLAVLYLSLYALGFILPPAIVVIVIAATDELFGVSEFIRERMPIIKLITAITLIVLGLITILL